MDIRQLECFVAVAEELSFSRASRRLHVATSGVSQHIRQLEREIDLQLLHRTSRRVQLTDPGRTVYDQARRILAELSDIREMAHKTPTSASPPPLVIAFPAGTGDLVGDLTKATAETLPGITLQFQPLLSSSIITELNARQLDLGITRWTETGFSSVLLSSEPESAVLMPHGHRLATRASVELADFDGEDIIIIDRLVSPRGYYHQTRNFLDRGIRPRFRPFRFPNTMAAMELVVAGYGCIVSTFSQVHTYAPRGTSIRPIIGEVSTMQHFLLARQSDTSPHLRAFMAMAHALTGTTQG
jgi:DNA-binding transcriptional LysR family regulator